MAFETKVGSKSSTKGGHNHVTDFGYSFPSYDTNNQVAVLSQSTLLRVAVGRLTMSMSSYAARAEASACAALAVVSTYKSSKLRSSMQAPGAELQGMLYMLQHTLRCYDVQE